MSASRLCYRCGHGTGSQPTQFFIPSSCGHDGTFPLCLRCVEDVRTDEILRHELHDTIDALCSLCREERLERELTRIRSEVPALRRQHPDLPTMESRVAGCYRAAIEADLRKAERERDAKATVGMSATDAKEAVQLQSYLELAWKAQEERLSGQRARLVRKFVHILTMDPTLSHIETLTDEDITEMLRAVNVLSQERVPDLPLSLKIKLFTAGSTRRVPLQWHRWGRV